MKDRKKDRHKNRVRNNAKSYSERYGNQGSYEELNKDTLEGSNFADCQTPWAKRPLSDIEYNQIDSLHTLYPLLKGRQKQVLELLLEGEINQTNIAKRLKMNQSDVNDVIGEIRKKTF